MSKLIIEFPSDMYRSLFIDTLYYTDTINILSFMPENCSLNFKHAVKELGFDGDTDPILIINMEDEEDS